MKKIYVVDDSALVRERLIEMLSDLPEVKVVGQTSNPCEVLSAIHELGPDAVILDIRLPGRNGIDVLKDIKRDKPHTIVIMLTDYAYPQYRKECMASGADYFLNKATEFHKIPDLMKKLIKDSQVYESKLKTKEVENHG